MSPRKLYVIGCGLITVGVIVFFAGVAYQFLLPKRYTARVRLSFDQIDRPPSVNGGPFVQTVPERVLAKVTLYPVIENLNLTKRWAARRGEPTALPLDLAYRTLKDRLTIRPWRYTSLVAIAVSSDERYEAAEIANEVARVLLEAARERQRAERGRHEQLPRDGHDGLLIRDFDLPPELIDPAEPPSKPDRPIHVLGVGLLLLGTLAALSGVLLVTARSRHPRGRK